MFKSTPWILTAALSLFIVSSFTHVPNTTAQDPQTPSAPTSADISKEWEEAKKWVDANFIHPEIRLLMKQEKLREILRKYTGRAVNPDGKKPPGNGWKVGDCDLQHPDALDIFDALINNLGIAVDNNMAALLNATTIYEIANHPYHHNGVSVGGYTHPTSPTGATRVTFYNPNAKGAFILARQSTALAQPADAFNMFERRDFIFLTALHEMAHVGWHIATHRSPQTSVLWTFAWSQALGSGGFPDQLYLNPNTGAASLVFGMDLEEGFAVAASYYWHKKTFANVALRQALEQVFDVLRKK